MIILIISILIIVFSAIRFKFWRDVLFITLLVLFLTWIGAQIANTSFFKTFVYPESNVLDDFELIDFAFAKQRPSPIADQRIAIVNIGHSQRADIANQINIARKYGTKVIGIDIFFINDSEVDTTGSYLLKKAIKDAGNVVFVCLITGHKNKSNADSILFSDDEFMEFAKTGYANLGSGSFSNGTTVLRDFSPKQVVNGTELYAFATQIAFQYDSGKALKFMNRKNEYEKINFRGNIDNRLENQAPVIFHSIDAKQFESEDFKPDLLKDKILLLGYMGDNLETYDLNDHFITPLNPEPYKKRIPDMYGIVVHANIIAMILNEDYIVTISLFKEFIFAFYVCFFHVSILLLLYNKWHVWFDLLALIIIILQLLVYSWLRLFLFNYFDVAMNLYITLASLAIASIAINIYNEVLPFIKSKVRGSVRNQE